MFKNHGLFPDEIAKEIERLYEIQENTADGVPEGLGESEAALYSYLMDNLEDIVSYLKTWDSE